MPERRYLLDTNILSDLIRNREGLVFHRIAEVSESSVCTSIIVACELRYGAFKKNAPNLTRKVEQLLGVLEILPLRPETDHHYARIRHPSGKKRHTGWRKRSVDCGTNPHRGACVGDRQHQRVLSG